MFNCKGKFKELMESVVDRAHNCGFLIGDYVKIDKNYKRNKCAAKWYDSLNDEYKKVIDDMVNSEYNLRIAEIDTPKTPAAFGLVTSQDAVGATRYLTIYEEWAAGRWGNIVVVPSCIVKRLDTGNNWTPNGPKYRDEKITMKPVEAPVDMENRNLPKSNTTIPSSSVKDGKNQAKAPKKSK